MPEGFVKIVARDLVGKQVEIFQGINHEVLEYSQGTKPVRCVLRGKLLEALGECFVVECKVRDKKEKVYINSWSIMSMHEFNGLTVGDMYTPAARGGNYNE